MIPRVAEAKHAGDYRVWLRFTDGLEGEIDLSDVLWGPVFQPLKDVKKFAKLSVDPDWHTIVWPNDLDIAPKSLYERLKIARAEQDAAE